MSDRIQRFGGDGSRAEPYFVRDAVAQRVRR